MSISEWVNKQGVTWWEGWNPNLQDDVSLEWGVAPTMTRGKGKGGDCWPKTSAPWAWKSRSLSCWICGYKSHNNEELSKIKTSKHLLLQAWPHRAFKLQLSLYTLATLDDSKIPNPRQASLCCSLCLDHSTSAGKLLRFECPAQQF